MLSAVPLLDTISYMFWPNWPSPGVKIVAKKEGGMQQNHLSQSGHLKMASYAETCMKLCPIKERRPTLQDTPTREDRFGDKRETHQTIISKANKPTEECRLLEWGAVYILCEPMFRGTYRLHLQSRKFRERGTSVSRWQSDEDGGDTFFRNVCSHKIYMAPHPRRRYSS
jgi:hypothetical protein